MTGYNTDQEVENKIDIREKFLEGLLDLAFYSIGSVLHSKFHSTVSLPDGREVQGQKIKSVNYPGHYEISNCIYDKTIEDVENSYRLNGEVSYISAVNDKNANSLEGIVIRMKPENKSLPEYVLNIKDSKDDIDPTILLNYINCKDKISIPMIRDYEVLEGDNYKTHHVLLNPVDTYFGSEIRLL